MNNFEMVPVATINNGTTFVLLLLLLLLILLTTSSSSSQLYGSDLVVLRRRMDKISAGSPVTLSTFMVLYFHAIVSRLRHDTSFQVLSNGPFKNHLTFDVRPI